MLPSCYSIGLTFSSLSFSSFQGNISMLALRLDYVLCCHLYPEHYIFFLSYHVHNFVLLLVFVICMSKREEHISCSFYIPDILSEIYH